MPVKPKNNKQVPSREVIESFLDVVRNGDIDTVDSMMRDDPTLGAESSVCPGGLTAMDHAARAGRPSLVSFFLEKGAQATSSHLTQALLMFARNQQSAGIKRDDTRMRKRVIDALIDNGVDPNELDAYGQRPLARAIRTRRIPLVNHLVWRGARADTLKDDPSGSLIFMAINYSSKAIDAVIKAGADPNIRWFGDRGQTPLEQVLFNGDRAQRREPVVAAQVRSLIAGGADIYATIDEEKRTIWEQFNHERSHFTEAARAVMDHEHERRQVELTSQTLADLGPAVESRDTSARSSL